MNAPAPTHQQILNLGPTAEDLKDRYAPAILEFLDGKPTQHRWSCPMHWANLIHRAPGPVDKWDLGACDCGHLWRLSELKHFVYRKLNGKANGDTTSRILRLLRKRETISYDATRTNGGVYRRHDA